MLPVSRLWPSSLRMDCARDGRKCVSLCKLKEKVPEPKYNNVTISDPGFDAQFSDESELGKVFNTAS